MRMNPKGFLRLPKDLGFEIWGLSDNFTGERRIGLWDADPGDDPLQESARVYRVTTDHIDSAARVFISVHTVPKHPRSHGVGEYGFRDAAGAALHHAADKSAWCEPGTEELLDILEVLRPSGSPGDPEWGHHRLIVAGAEREGHFLSVGRAWAAVVELATLVIGVSGCGVEADAYGLVPIDNYTRYASQRWPRERRRPPIP